MYELITGSGTSRTGVGASALWPGLALLSVAACSQSSSYAVPEQVCGISVSAGVLRPLLPAGKELRAEAVDLGGGSCRCKISVDKKLALYLQAVLAPSDTDAVQVRKRELDRYGNPAPSDVGGQGRVADRGALAAADVTAFIGAYLPAVQKSLACGLSLAELALASARST